MKTTKLLLVLFLITAFGTTEFYAQTVDASSSSQPVKTKRKYTKKSDASAAVMVSANGPVTATAVKAKRKYTKKNKTDASPSVVATSTIDDHVTKTKSSYTKKIPANSVAPSTSTMESSTPYTSSPGSTKRVSKPTIVKQTYSPKNGGNYNGHQILVGPRGGKYYINKNGNKTYVK